MRIVIQETSTGLDEVGKEYWDIDVSYDLRRVRQLRLSSPWSAEQEEECSWYVEVFASNSGSPFEKRRGEDCHEQLLEYGRSIHALLGLSDLAEQVAHNILIDVVAASFSSTLHRLHWEILEFDGLWCESSKVQVRRTFNRTPSLTPTVIECDTLNVLLIIARPHAEDIEYLSVAQRIFQVVQKVKERAPVVSIEIVRPGTWEATLKHLDTRSKGYFQVVHLDVHGLLIEDGPRKGVYLQFLDKSGTTARFKNAIIVGKTLREYRVQAVILNACNSASAKSSDFQSLPASFLKAEIPIVVAMSANISSTAVQKFVTGFYLSFVHQKQSFHAAASTARAILAKDRTRSARFGYSVTVDDWIIPSLYALEDIRFGPLHHASEFQAEQGSMETLIAKLNLILDGFKDSSHDTQALKRVLVEARKYLDSSESGLVGRDGAILELENAFLINRLHNNVKIPKKHIHLYGRPGTGKTAILVYLSWWWQLTSLFDKIVYVNCHNIYPWSIEKLFEKIDEQLGQGKTTANSQILLGKLNEVSCLLILDNLEFLSKEGSGIDDDQRAELVQFLDLLHTGQSRIIAASRNQFEPFMSATKGEFYPMRLANLDSSNAMKLARACLSRQSNALTFSITDPEELDRLQYLLEYQEYSPAGIEGLIDLMCTNMSRPREFLSLLIHLKPFNFSTCSMQSRRGFEIEASMVDLTSKASNNPEALKLLFIILSLCSFHRRFPLQIEPYLMYLLILPESAARADFRQLTEYIYKFSLGIQETVIDAAWPEELFKQARRLALEAIAFLKQHDLIWLESLETPGGYTTLYWHIDPLFSLAAKTTITHSITDAEESYSISYLYSHKIALAHYYENRIFAFNDAEPLEAAHSVKRTLFELENICTALSAWLLNGKPMETPSSILSHLATSFNLLTLEKQDFRIIKNALNQVAEFYETAQLSLTEGDEIGRRGLENFLVATGQLQNVSFAEEDWSQVRNYTARIRQMLKRNPTSLKVSPFARDHQAQTSQVEGYEMFSRREFVQARARFKYNLAQLPIGELSRARQVARAKLRMMNLLGLLKCDFESLEVGETHIREVEVRYQAFKHASDQYAELLRSSPFLQGWAMENKQFEADYEPMGKYLRIFRNWADNANEESKNIISAVSAVMKSYTPRNEVRQNAAIIFQEALRDADNFSDANKYVASLLNGLETAYRNNADAITLSRLYYLLTSAHIQLENFEAGLEYHKAWCKFTNQSQRPDDHTRLYESYVYALCFYHIGKANESREYLSKAFAILEGVDAKRIKFSCLHIQAMFDLEHGNFEESLKAICDAGRLSYQNENERFGQPGSTLRFLAYVATTASRLASEESGVTDSEAVSPTSSYPEEIQNIVSTHKSKQKTLNDIFQYTMRIMGLKKYLHLAKIMMSGLPDLFEEDGSFKWEVAERIFFTEDEENILDYHHVSALNSTDVHTWGRPSLHNPKDAGERLGSEARQEEVPTELENTSDGDKDATEIAVSMLMRVSGTMRYHRKRSILWYLAGPREADTIPMHEEYAEHLSKFNSLDSESRASIIEVMVKAGTDVDIFDDRGITPFMRAIVGKDYIIANTLLRVGAEPNRVDFTDETALHQAVTCQDLASVQYCISVGCSPHMKNAQGETALALAVKLDSYEICRSLINSGANVLARDNIGVSCITLAMKEKQHNNAVLCLNTLSHFGVDVIRAVLLDYGFAERNFVDYFVEQFLELKDEDHDWIEFFNSVFIIPDDFNGANYAGQSPYHRAAWRETPEIVNQLFVSTEASANNNDNTIFGLTPAMAACFSKTPQDMLLTIGTNDPTSFGVKSSYGDFSAANLIGWVGLKITLDDEVIHESSSQYERVKKIALFWAKSARLQYYQNLSEDALDQLRDFRRQLAFEDVTSLAAADLNPVFIATNEIGHNSADEATQDPSGQPLSRFAKNVRYMEHALTRNIKDGDSDGFIEYRFEVAWKGNLRLLPQIYHMDRHGRCRYVQPAADRIDQSYCIWIVDELGEPRGVLGALELDSDQEDDVSRLDSS